MAARCRDLTKQIDLAAKLAGRAVDIAVRELDARDSNHWANTDINAARRVLVDARAAGVEALRRARYFVLQADWLQERFPNAELRDVEGLVKLVNRAEIEEHDWSLTPGRYVGVAPEEEDEDFNFEEALRSIHIELLGLNEEASQLAAQIARDFEELGVDEPPFFEKDEAPKLEDFWLEHHLEQADIRLPTTLRMEYHLCEERKSFRDSSDQVLLSPSFSSPQRSLKL